MPRGTPLTRTRCHRWDYGGRCVLPRDAAVIDGTVVVSVPGFSRAFSPVEFPTVIATGTQATWPSSNSRSRTPSLGCVATSWLWTQGAGDVKTGCGVCLRGRYDETLKRESSRTHRETSKRQLAQHALSRDWTWKSSRMRVRRTSCVHVCMHLERERERERDNERER